MSLDRFLKRSGAAQTTALANDSTRLAGLLGIVCSVLGLSVAVL